MPCQRDVECQTWLLWHDHAVNLDSKTTQTRQAMRALAPRAAPCHAFENVELAPQSARNFFP
jgi:hypothetical protein